MFEVLIKTTFSVHWGAFGATNPSSIPPQVPPSQSYSDIYGKSKMSNSSA